MLFRSRFLDSKLFEYRDDSISGLKLFETNLRILMKLVSKTNKSLFELLIHKNILRNAIITNEFYNLLMLLNNLAPIQSKYYFVIIFVFFFDNIYSIMFMFDVITIFLLQQ